MIRPSLLRLIVIRQTVRHIPPNRTDDRVEPQTRSHGDLDVVRPDFVGRGPGLPGVDKRGATKTPVDGKPELDGSLDLRVSPERRSADFILGTQLPPLETPHGARASGVETLAR